MIHDVSTTEFITGIINDRYDENDIVKYCSGLSNIKAFWVALIVEHSKIAEIGNAPIIAFGKDATITKEENDSLSIDDRRKLGRIQNAIFIVEEFMQKQQRQKESVKPQHGKENAIELYITGNNKEAVIQAIKTLVSDTKGKHPAAVIFVAVSDGYMMSKPTFEILKEAFGIVGTKSAFNIAYSKYRDDKRNTYEEDINSARAALKRVLEGAF